MLFFFALNNRNARIENKIKKKIANETGRRRYGAGRHYALFILYCTRFMGTILRCNVEPNRKRAAHTRLYRVFTTIIKKYDTTRMCIVHVHFVHVHYALPGGTTDFIGRNETTTRCTPAPVSNDVKLRPTRVAESQ